MARGFVAVVPPRDVLDAVGKLSWRAAHRPSELSLPRLVGPRWTTREKWHLTLQFLGTSVDLDAAADALARVRAAPLQLRLGGVGGFPSERRANVLWIGVRDGTRDLSAVASAVADAMTPVVGPPEARAFHPHLTLTRLTRPADLRLAVAASRGPVGPAWTADRLVLFESVTASSGAQYRVHADVALDRAE